MKLKNLKPDPANARRHTQRNLEAISNSIAAVGTARSIVIDENGVVLAGNGVVEAAANAGIQDVRIIDADGATLIAVRRKGLTEKQKRQLALADNQTSELSEWDIDQLTKDLEAFSADEAASIGFDPKVLREIGITTEESHDSYVEARVEIGDALNKKWNVKRGDLWEIGDHRLLCGDSMDSTAYNRLLGELKPTLVFTDPPYGIDIAGKNEMLSTIDKSRRRHSGIADDDINAEALQRNIMVVIENVKRVMADDCSVFICAPGGADLLNFLVAMRDAGLPMRHGLVWCKNNPTFSVGRLDYDYQHEMILYTWGKSHKRMKQGPLKSTVWNVDRPMASPEHPTVKPEQLVENCLMNHTEASDAVMDPYCGSGTTIAACQRLNRRGFGIEISVAYCAVILDRLERMGLNPKLVSDAI